MLGKRRVGAVIAASFGLSLASSLFVPQKITERIALRNAKALWGEVSPAPPVVYYGLDDEPIAYGFVFAKGSRFPDHKEILMEVERNRREGRIREMWGEKRYYKMVVSARRDMPPIPVYGQGLLESYVLAHKFKEEAEKALRKKGVSLAKIYYITPLEKWYAYTDGRDTVYIRLYPPKRVYTQKEFNDLVRLPLLRQLSVKRGIEAPFKKLWDDMERGLKVLQPDTHLIYRYDLVPYYDWSYGCSPTAAAMLLGYWDNLGNEGFSPPFSNFVDYYFQRWDGVQWETDYQVPNLQRELALAMHTDSTTGGTWIENIGPGIQAVADANGYDFNVSPAYGGDSSNNWLWDLIVNEIDGNRPFEWGVMLASVGHSLTGVGYTDDNYVAVHNTWYPPLDYWYYNQWYDGTPAQFTTINTVTPGGSYGYSIKLTSPLGDTFYNSDGWGEVWNAGETYEITWTGDLGIGYASIDYSINGGLSWRPIIDSTENTGSYLWDITDYAVSNRARVRVRVYSGDTLMGADGSKGNFTILGTPVPGIRVTPDTVVFDYSPKEVVVKPTSIQRLPFTKEVPKAKVGITKVRHPSKITDKPLQDEIEISYDDGSAEFYTYIWTYPGTPVEDEVCGWCTRMTPPSYPFVLTKVEFLFGEVAYDFYLHIYGDGGGAPGNNLLPTPYLIDHTTVPVEDWWVYDVSSENIVINSGDFYVGFCYSYLDSLERPTVRIGGDNTSPFDDRGWINLGIGWELISDLGSEYRFDLMIRAIGYTGETPPSLVDTMWVRNIGSANLEVTGMVPSESWIKSVYPTSFTLAPDDSQAVEIEVDTTGLADGEYIGYVSIYSNDPERSIYDEPVKLIKESISPKISVSPDTLDFEFASEKTLDSKTLPMWVKNEGDADLIVTDITTQAEWITYIQPKQFTIAPYDSQVVAVKADNSGIPPGTYYDSLLIYSNDLTNNPYLEPVKLFKMGEPDIAVKPDTLSYDLSVNEPLTDTMWIYNPGQSELSVKSQTTTPWITDILPPQFTVLPNDSQAVEVRIDTTGLSDGLFYGQILLENNTPTKSPYIEPVRLNKAPGILENPLPSVLRLRRVSPNPSLSIVSIYYDLPYKTSISLKVYDATGRLVKTLIMGSQEPGYKSIIWKGLDNRGKRVPPGIYFLRMLTPEYKKVEKLILYK